MRIRRGVGTDGVHGHLGFAQFERALGRADQHQNAFGARQVDAFEQGACHSLLGGNTGAVRASGHGGTHHGFARLTHDGAHVFKVDVHMAWHVDDFSNTAHRVFQHVVGMGKGFVLRDIVAQHFKQLFVEHHDQGVHIGFEFGQTAVGIGHAATAFKLEGLGDHAHGQNAHFAGYACNHGGSASTGAAAHAGGNEEHVRAFNGSANVFYGQLGRFTAFVRLAASTQTAGAQLNDAVRVAARQGLGIGVGTDEFHALHGAVNHVPHGIAATTADTDHLDLGSLVKHLFFNHFYRHFYSPNVPKLAVAEIFKFESFLCAPNYVGGSAHRQRKNGLARAKQ